MEVYSLGVYDLDIYGIGLPDSDLGDHTSLGSYSMGFYSLGVYGLGLPILELNNQCETRQCGQTNDLQRQHTATIGTTQHEKKKAAHYMGDFSSPRHLPRNCTISMFSFVK